LASTLSLLRRAHAHHRDLRTLDAGARAAPRSHCNRDAIMTRRDLRSTRAATPLVAAIAICARFAKIVTKNSNLASGQRPIQQSPGAKSNSPHPRQRHRRPATAIIILRQNPKSR
jgi:hypothetical protein